MKIALVIFCLLDPQPGAVQTVKTDLEHFRGANAAITLPPAKLQHLKNAITDMEHYALFSVKDDVTREMVASYFDVITGQRKDSFGGTSLSNIHILPTLDAVDILVQAALRGECQLGNL